MREESGAWHIGGLLVMLLLLGTAFVFFSSAKRLPELESQIQFLQRRVDVMQKQLDDIDLRLKVSEINP